MIPVLAVAGLAGLGCRESLWLDELHTSWTESAPGGELIARAFAGNQQPLYFWLLKGVTSTLGHHEWSLRLLSVLSSMASALVVFQLLAAQSGPGQRSILAAVLLCGWFALDRIQLFYATEARVYALWQLLNLLGWCCIAATCHALHTSTPATVHRRPQMAWCIGWCCLALLSIHLHLIAVLPLAWQWLFAAAFCVWRRHFRELAIWSLVAVIVLLGATPAMPSAADVWSRRQQWESFAGDASWQTVLELFPIIPLFVPALVALAIDWCRHRGLAARSSPTLTDWMSDVAPRNSACLVDFRRFTTPWCQTMWCWAATGPLVTAWLATASEITPLLHRRYLLCSALPLLILAATLVLRLRWKKLQWATVAATTLWLIAAQGTLNIWLHRQIVGWQRGEDWRSAARWVEQRIQEDDEVWCASGLIEAKAASVPPTPEMNQYLSFPLRGMYQISNREGRTFATRALYGNVHHWRQLLSAPVRPRSDTRLYVVYRGSTERLLNRLERLTAAEAETGFSYQIEHTPVAFGRVCAAVLEPRRPSNRMR